MSRVLVISLSDLGRDPRVDRQISFLLDRHEVIAAGLGPPTDPAVEYVDLNPSPLTPALEKARQGRSLARLLTRDYESVYWLHPVTVLAMRRLRAHNADVVIANDLTALPLSTRVAGAAPVIFDAHELHTAEQAEHLWWRVIMRPYVDHLLRSYLPRTAGMMTVAPGIARDYSARYGVSPVVVTNAPWRTDLRPGAVMLPIRVIHHGNADPQRRLELMVEAMDQLDDRFELTLMLAGSHARYLNRLRRLAERRPRVHLVKPVALPEIVPACNAHDVGLYVLPPRNDNLLHALPNKIFEFIQARLAVVVGPSPEMASLVRDQECGLVAGDFTPEAVAATLGSLTAERVQELKAGADRAATVLNAEHNRQVLLTLVEDVLSA